MICVACLVGVVLCMPLWGEINMLSDIVYKLAFGDVSISIVSISKFLFAWFPLLFFQTVMGNYIYERFCITSVYFFSRCNKKSRWYIIETAKLFCYVMGYVATMLLAAYITTKIFGKVHTDEQGIILVVYYLLIYSLWLFVGTLLINILSIAWDCTKSFFVIISVQLISIAIYGILEEWMDFYKYTGSNMENQIFVLKAIPISNLVLKWHGSDYWGITSGLGILYEFNFSVAILSFCAIFTLGVGIFVIKKHDFIDNGRMM